MRERGLCVGKWRMGGIYISISIYIYTIDEPSINQARWAMCVCGGRAGGGTGRGRAMGRNT